MYGALIGFAFFIIITRPSDFGYDFTGKIPINMKVTIVVFMAIGALLFGQASLGLR